jgi:hypothetical protein
VVKVVVLLGALVPVSRGDHDEEMTSRRQLMPEALEKSAIVFHVLENADEQDQGETRLALETLVV